MEGGAAATAGGFAAILESCSFPRRVCCHPGVLQLSLPWVRGFGLGPYQHPGIPQLTHPSLEGPSPSAQCLGTNPGPPSCYCPSLLAFSFCHCSEFCHCTATQQPFPPGHPAAAAEFWVTFCFPLPAPAAPACTRFLLQPISPSRGALGGSCLPWHTPVFQTSRDEYVVKAKFLLQMKNTYKDQ